MHFVLAGVSSETLMVTAESFLLLSHLSSVLRSAYLHLSQGIQWTRPGILVSRRAPHQIEKPLGISSLTFPIYSSPLLCIVFFSMVPDTSATLVKPKPMRAFDTRESPETKGHKVAKERRVHKQIREQDSDMLV